MVLRNLTVISAVSRKYYMGYIKYETRPNLVCVYLQILLHRWQGVCLQRLHHRRRPHGTYNQDPEEHHERSQGTHTCTCVACCVGLFTSLFGLHSVSDESGILVNNVYCYSYVCVLLQVCVRESGCHVRELSPFPVFRSFQQCVKMRCFQVIAVGLKVNYLFVWRYKKMI